MKTLRHGAAWLVLGLLAVLAAWLLSNTIDSPEQPAPAELLGATPTDPPGNAFYPLLALTVAERRDADADGRVLWAREADAARVARIQAGGPGVAAAEVVTTGLDASAIALPSGKPAVCSADDGHCVAAWLAAPGVLAAQLAPAGPAWSRCQALAGRPYAEQVPDNAAILVGSYGAHRGLSQCGRLAAWHAAVATARGDLPAAAAALVQGRKLLDGAEPGLQSAIGYFTAARIQQQLRRTVADLVAARPALLGALAAAGYPLQATPPPAPHARHWLLHERRFQLAFQGSLRTRCGVDSTAKGALLADFTERTFCHAMAALPQQTRQDWDARLLRDWQALAGGLAPALAQRPAHVEPETLAWRNTVARLMAGTVRPLDWIGVRQADAELDRAAAGLALGLAQARVPAPDQAAWVAQNAPGWFRPEDAAVQAPRLQLADGRIRARTWGAAAPHGLATAIDWPVPTL